MQRYGITTYAGGALRHASMVRAGRWVFGSGLRAVDASGAPLAELRHPGRRLDAAPKAEREAAWVFGRMAALLEEAGSSLAQVVRLDQYYPGCWQAVDPYHTARKAAMKGRVAPSTSVLVSQLLSRGSEMDVQVMAAAHDSGLTVEPVSVSRVGAPKESGYSPCVRCGDLLFVAGQLARDDSGDLAPDALVPATQLWKGTRIKKETRYLIEHRLKPTLEAAGSEMDLVLKAQVYLSEETDLPAFWQEWSAAFKGAVPPTTVVPVKHPAFGTHEARIEVNLIAAHEQARGRLADVEMDGVLPFDGMLAARRLDELVFLPGLMAIDEHGLVESARIPAETPYFVDSVGRQMDDILDKAGRILDAAGSSLGQVARALHFHRDLAGFPAAHAPWRALLGETPLPFSAVGTGSGLFVPGAEVIVDLIGYAP